MRIGIASPYAYELSWAARLQDEGADVAYWVSVSTNKSVGDGIVPKKNSWDELLFWAKEGIRKKEPTLLLFGGTSLGEKADLARKWGIPIICGGSFCDKLEKDRSFGQEIAASIGIKIPAFKEFKDVSACINHAKAMGEQPMFFKSDSYVHLDATHGANSGPEMVEYLEDLQRRYPVRGSCILQEKIDGVPFSTGRWWNGMSWVGPYEATYENKKLMNDDIGPSTSCAFNTVWFYEQNEPEIAKKLGWEELTPIFRKHNAPPGFYDINAMIDKDGAAWFLEWTPRLGYSSEMTSGRLIEHLGDHLWEIANGREPAAVYDDLAYAVTLGVPPYPVEYVKLKDEASPDGTAVYGVDGLWDGNFIGYCVKDNPDGELALAGPEGFLGLTLATGEKLSLLHEEAIDFATNILRCPGVMLRTDGDEDCKEAAQSLLEAGLDIHEGLLL